MAKSNSIFAMEVCARIEQGSSLLDDLRAVIANQPVKAGYAEKWSAYRRAAEVLHANLHAIERGCWDYFDDHQRAVRDFEHWSEIVVTEEGARVEPSGTVDPYRPEPRYLTFTMAFLLLQDTPTDLEVSSLCNIPQDQLWQKATFARLLRGMGVINFASVEADVMYLIPRDPTWSLTLQDLSQEKFAYLRVLAQ